VSWKHSNLEEQNVNVNEFWMLFDFFGRKFKAEFPRDSHISVTIDAGDTEKVSIINLLYPKGGYVILNGLDVRKIELNTHRDTKHFSFQIKSTED